MNHSQAWFLVVRDVMWFLVVLVPPILFMDACSREKEDINAEAAFGIALISYAAVLSIAYWVDR